MPKFGTDYSKSALDLKNPLEVRDLLIAYGKAQAASNEANDALEAVIVELPERVAAIKAASLMDTAHKAVKAAIDRCGSLQDIEEGLYAFKQGRQRVSYNPSMVRELLPEFASAIIIEKVNESKINGLVKGGLIDKVTLKRLQVRTDLAPAYIIGLAQKPEVEVASGD